MASGSYAKQKPRKPIEAQTRSVIPQRATRQLSEIVAEEEETEPSVFQSRLSRALQPARTTEKINVSFKPRKVVDEFAPHPLARHKVWLNPIVICMVVGAVSVAVLLSAGMAQRSGEPQLVDYTGGKVYNVQVGGNSLAGTWQSNKAIPPSVPIPSQSGPYSVLGKPSISAAFINQVLASYNSPAAGKGQALYNLGELIRNLYVAQWGLTTVDKIIPTYAPAADNNNEAAYIASVKHALDTWHSGVLRP